MILTLNQAADEEVFLVGGKAKQLGILRGLAPCPNGFVITTDAFVHQEGATQRTFNGKITKELRTKILDAYDALGEGLVAVRSSGAAEDGEQHSFAGQHDTFLNVNREGLIDAIEKCWSSAYSERVQEYKQAHKITAKPQLAVIVQSMVQADVSGVMYTKHPTTGSDMILIDSTHGLGELLVSGSITPDHTIVTQNTVTCETAHKPKKLTQDGMQKNPLADSHSLSEKHIDQLKILAKRIEKYYGKPQDIEFVIKHDIVYVVQTRPLTTITSPSRNEE